MVRYAWGWDPVDPNGPVANLTDVNGYLASPFETVNYSDMMVLGPGSVTIQDLNLTPLTTNGTDFATVGYSQPMTETFTIANASDALASLSLTGLADGGTSLVRLTGPNSSEFSVVSQPLASALAVGGTTTFQVAFQPVSTGLAQAILQIPNNTPHKTPYTIYLQGTGKDDRTPTFTPTGTWYTSTSTMTPTPTNTLTPTVTPNIAVSMIDDFDENNLGNAATRTNLWGQPWGAFLGPSGNSTSINVSYFSPGAANTSTSVSIYGNLASGGYCNYLTYLKSGSAAYNAVAAGYTGIQFYIYGDVTGHTYRAQIMSASITTGDYLGQNVVVQADGQWHLIQIPFSTMTQAGWGTQTGLPPTGTDMTGVKFDVVSPTAGAYYFLLDQVSLYGPVPTSTYTPTISPTFTPTPSGTWFTSTYTITSTPTITFTPTASLTPTLSPTPAGTDNTVYNFEDGTVMGWSYVNNQAIATQNTGGIFYLGSHSLAVSLNVTAPATDSEFGAQPVTSVASNLTGKFVIAHLWVPSTFPTSSTADIYLKSGAAWGWQTGPTVTLTPGAWNTLTLNPAVPFNAAGTSDITNVQGIGVQIFASAAWAGTIYLDSVDILSGTPTPTTTPLNTATPPPTATPTITPTFATPTPNLTFTPSPTGTPTQTQSPTPTFTPIQNVDRPFPNPNNGSSPLFIYHNLTQPADRVSFKVYTLSFRKIYEDDSLPTAAGQFGYTLDWNKSGLSLSNGLYYFVIVEKRSSRETQTVLKELIIR